MFHEKPSICTKLHNQQLAYKIVKNNKNVLEKNKKDNWENLNKRERERGNSHELSQLNKREEIGKFEFVTLLILTHIDCT